MATSIFEYARRTVVLLTPNNHIASLDPQLQLHFDEIRSRFLIWAGNVGCLAAGDAGLDKRLHDDPDISALLLSLLESLNENLEEVFDPRVLARLEEEEEEEEDEEGGDEGARYAEGAQKEGSEAAEPHKEESGDELEEAGERGGRRGKRESELGMDSTVHEGDGDSAGSSSASSFDFGSAGSDVSVPLESNNTRPWSQSINFSSNILDRLYRLCSVLRKPVSSSENARVRAFIAKGKHIDVEELEAYRAHIEFHLDHHFKAHPLSDEIRNRLSDAAVFRKFKLLYRRVHQKKLEQGVKSSTGGLQKASKDDSADSFFPALASSDGFQISTANRLHRDLALPTPVKPESLSAIEPKRPSTSFGSTFSKFSATVASSVNRENYGKYVKSPGTIYSAITATGEARRQRLDVPNPPKPQLQENILECPYCCKIIASAEMKGSYWIKHLLKDIEPYVCLFQGCRRVDLLFRTSDEWLAHMQVEHNTVWRCRAPQHDSFIFYSQEELADHLRSDHPIGFTESQLLDLLKKSQLPASGIFDKLTSEWNTPEDDKPCHKCHENSTVKRQSKEVGQEALATDVLYQNILAHLEELALLSLPEADLDDMETCSARLTGAQTACPSHASFTAQSRLGGLKIGSDMADQGYIGDLEEEMDSIDPDPDWPVVPELEGDMAEKYAALIRLLDRQSDPNEDRILQKFRDRQNVNLTQPLVGQDGESATLGANPGSDNECDFVMTAAPIPGNGLWLVPHLRNPKFVGRDDILNTLEGRILKSDKPPKTMAIAGIIGLGKTAIVLEFSYRARQSNPNFSIIWIDASTPELFCRSLTAIRDQSMPDLDLDKHSKYHIMTVLAFVKHCLGDGRLGTQWILVLDGIRERDFFEGTDSLISQSSLITNGTIITTTCRRSISKQLADSTEVLSPPPVDLEFSELVLRSYFQLPTGSQEQFPEPYHFLAEIGSLPSDIVSIHKSLRTSENLRTCILDHDEFLSGDLESKHVEKRKLWEFESSNWRYWESDIAHPESLRNGAHIWLFSLSLFGPCTKASIDLLLSTSLTKEATIAKDDLADLYMLYLDTVTKTDLAMLHPSTRQSWKFHFRRARQLAGTRMGDPTNDSILNCALFTAILSRLDKYLVILDRTANGRVERLLNIREARLQKLLQDHPETRLFCSEKLLSCSEPSPFREICSLFQSDQSTRHDFYSVGAPEDWRQWVSLYTEVIYVVWYQDSVHGKVTLFHEASRRNFKLFSLLLEFSPLPLPREDRRMPGGQEFSQAILDLLSAGGSRWFTASRLANYLQTSIEFFDRRAQYNLKFSDREIRSAPVSLQKWKNLLVDLVEDTFDTKQCELDPKSALNLSSYLSDLARQLDAFEISSERRLDSSTVRRWGRSWGVKDIWNQVIRLTEDSMGADIRRWFCPVQSFLILKLVQKQEWKDAEETCLQAISGLTNSNSFAESTSEAHQHWIDGLMQLSCIYCKLSKWKNAEDALVQIIQQAQMSAKTMISPQFLRVFFRLSFILPHLRLCGGSQPETLTAMGQLARFLARPMVAKWQRAEDICVQVVQDQTADLLGMCSNSENWRKWWDIEGVLSMIVSNEEKFGKSLSEDPRPNRLTCMHYLAVIRTNVGKWPQARQMFEKVLSERQKILGESHPDTLETMAELRSIPTVKRGETMAEAWGRIFELRKGFMGLEHPRVRQARENVEDFNRLSGIDRESIAWPEDSGEGSYAEFKVSDEVKSISEDSTGGNRKSESDSLDHDKTDIEKSNAIPVASKLHWLQTIWSGMKGSKTLSNAEGSPGAHSE